MALDGSRAQALPLREDVGLCRIEAPAGQERALADLVAAARPMLPAIERELGIRPLARYRMLLIPPGVVRDSELVALEASAPAWAAGFILPAFRVGAIRIAQAQNYPYGSVASVLAHESTHLLLHDAVGGRLPRWFEEGVSMGQERRWSFVDAAMLSTSLGGRDLPPLDHWDEAFLGSAEEARLAYAAAFSFVAWQSRRGEPAVAARLVLESRRRPFGRAWLVVTGEPLEASYAEWRRTTAIPHRWLGRIAGASPLWIGITILALIAGLVRRARAREVRRRWEEEERRSWEIGP